MISALTALTTYKNAIIGGLIFVVLFSIGFGGIKLGAMRVQSKWDKQTIEIKTKENELATRVIELQTQVAERDRKQAEIDAQAAARGAEERARLEAQAKAVQTSLDRLTRDLAKSPQYESCKLDPDTLRELNRSLK